MKTVPLVIPVAGTLLLVAGTLLAPIRAGAEECSIEPGQVLESRAWQEFTSSLEDRYFAAAELEPSELRPGTLAKILGHALGAQARFVGDDTRRHRAYACLELGIDSEMTRLAQAYDGLLGPVAVKRLGADLTRLAREAAIGFYDDEISTLLGGDGAGPVATVLDSPLAGTPLSEPDSGQAPGEIAPLPAGTQVRGTGQTESAPCRFNLHPNLFNASHPAFRWYLLMRPWKGDGAYYDAVEADPDWPGTSSKRPENRLRDDQTIVLEGTKSEIARRVRQLQAACSK